MCVDSLLFKFKSDEKQLTRLFISVFASDCTLRPTKDGRSLSPCDAMRSGIGMTITFPGHPMSVIQHDFNHE